MATNPTVNQKQAPLDIAEYLDRRMRDIGTRMNCISIGKIVSFNATNQSAVVDIVYQRTLKGVVPIPGAIGAGDLSINYPRLADVPCVILGGGGAHLTFPINTGDFCLLLIADRDIDNWLNTSNANPVPPATDRTHDLTDAIALVGLSNFVNPLSNYNSVLASLMDITGERLVQSGMMSAFAGASAPSGWLLCQGQAISRTTYASLFNAIGTNYGTGDGSTTFNLPNMQGQVPAGIGGTLALTLGQEFGEVSHTLTIPEMPSHNHQVKSTGSGATGYASAGYNTYGDVTSSTGGGSSHNNVQPSLGVNWIIKI